MAFSDFWRGDRGRERSESERERWRDAQRSSDHGRREDYTARDEDHPELQDEGFERRGWRPGSDYYGNRPESFRGYGRESSTQRYGHEDFGDRSSGRGRSFNDRWQDSYGSEGPGELSGQGMPRHGHAGMPGTGMRSFRGRGPRGYSRSDERIREDVCERLTDDEWVDASEVEVVVVGGEVTLEGSVESRDQKRRAEDIADQQPGVKDVHNNIRVIEGAQRADVKSRRQPSSPQSGETRSTQSGETTQSSRH